MKTAKSKKSRSNLLRRRRNPAPHRATSAEILGRTTPNSSTSPPDPIPVRWRGHWETLLSLRERLATEHGALRQTAAEPLEPHSLSDADSATDEFDHTLALRKLSAEQDALNEVDAAIQRLLAGSYGICEESGKPIPAKRLRAIPWTRFTREVEERFEQEGSIARARVGNVRTIRGDGKPWRPPRPPRRHRSRRSR